MNRCVVEEWVSTSAMSGTSRGDIVDERHSRDGEYMTTTPIESERLLVSYIHVLLTLGPSTLPRCGRIDWVNKYMDSSRKHHILQIASTVECRSLATSGDGEQRAVDGAVMKNMASRKHSD